MQSSPTRGICLSFLLKNLARWSRDRFLAGASRYIQQESTFWRRDLWGRPDGRLDSAYRYAGYCELCVRFFPYAQLYHVDALIGGFRPHADAITYAAKDEYERHFGEIIERQLSSRDGAGKVKLFRRVSGFTLRIPKVRGLWQRTAVKALHQLPGSGWPPVIEYQGETRGFRRK